MSEQGETGIQHGASGTEHHAISARATAYHYAQYDDPEEIPQEDKAFPLTDFDQWSVAHIGYECTCGQRFIFGRTAAEHLRSVDTITETEGR